MYTMTERIPPVVSDPALTPQRKGLDMTAPAIIDSQNLTARARAS